MGLLALGGVQIGNEEEGSTGDSPTILDAGYVEDFDIGEPVRFEDYGFWLVRLEPQLFVALVDDDTLPRFSADDDCAIVWRQDVVILGRAGWFRGSCSGSNFDRDGTLVSGPSALSMYRFHVELLGSRVLVEVGVPLCPNEYGPRVACPRAPYAPIP